MNTLLQLFSIDKTFFTIFNYPMSYVEFFGTILNLACVWLVAKKHILNWPVGIAGVIFFAALFYQLHLYADLSEQFYYFITGIWGWYAWAKIRRPGDAGDAIVVYRNSWRTNLIWIVGIGIFTAIGTWVMTHINVWLPSLFPVPASLPVLDTWTTIMSFAAQILMIQKRLENWILWIIVDVIAIWLYAYKGVPFVAMLYAVFLVLAVMGLITWNKTYKGARHESPKAKRTGDREILPAA